MNRETSPTFENLRSFFPFFPSERFIPLDLRGPGDPDHTRPNTPPPAPPNAPGGGTPPPPDGGGGNWRTLTRIGQSALRSVSENEDDGESDNNSNNAPVNHVKEIDSGQFDKDAGGGLVMPNFGFPELDNSRFKLVNPDGDIGVTKDLIAGGWRMLTGRSPSILGIMGFITQRPTAKSVGIGLVVGAGAFFLLPEAAVVGVAVEAEGVAAGAVLDGWAMLSARIQTATQIGSVTTKLSTTVGKIEERINGFIQVSDALDKFRTFQDHTPGSQRGIVRRVHQ